MAFTCNPKKHFMDFVQILCVGFSIFDDTNAPTKGTQFTTYAGLMQSYNVNPIEDFHQTFMAIKFSGILINSKMGKWKDSPSKMHYKRVHEDQVE